MSRVRVTRQQQVHALANQVAGLAVGCTGAVTEQFSELVCDGGADFFTQLANVGCAHLRHRFLLVAKGSVSLLKEHCPRFWNTAQPPITDRVLHDPELQGQRVDATFGFYGFVENVHALSVSRS